MFVGSLRLVEKKVFQKSLSNMGAMRSKIRAALTKCMGPVSLANSLIDADLFSPERKLFLESGLSMAAAITTEKSSSNLVF